MERSKVYILYRFHDTPEYSILFMEGGHGITRCVPVLAYYYIDNTHLRSQSAWYHLTSPNSWPYYHSVVSTGIGLPPSKWEGATTDLIRNTVFQKAKVSNVDELRQKSTAQLKDVFEDTYYLMNPAHKQTPGDPIYGPVIDEGMIQDHQVTLVRNGAIRKGFTL